ncbi:phage tail sheath C-terminal domain-containing protein [Enterobacter roggenkampii]
MTVPFARVPDNLRVGLFFVEFDNSLANNATATQRTLLIGGMLSTGSTPPGIPQRVSSSDTVGELTGKGGILQAMMAAYQKNDTAAEVWILPLEEDSGSMVAATGTIKVSSAPTATGVISLYIAGERIQLTSKFGRMKLAADGTRFAPGAAIVTPNIIKADQIAEYQTLVWNGYAQDAEAFAKNIIVEQNAKNPNRVDVLWPGTLMNQLRIFALLNQFRTRAESTGA